MAVRNDKNRPIAVTLICTKFSPQWEVGAESFTSPIPITEMDIAEVIDETDTETKWGGRMVIDYARQIQEGLLTEEELATAMALHRKSFYNQIELNDSTPTEGE